MSQFQLRYTVDNPEYNNPPRFGSEEAACFDIQSVEDVLILPGGTYAVKTGLHFDIPIGYEMQIRSRSGLALKSGIHVLNSPGTIDSDYTGEIKVILHNTTPNPFKIIKGDRIAQGMLHDLPVTRNKDYNFVLVDNLKITERGSGGFGSTGVA